MDTSLIPLIVILGPTSSGKTALAIELALRFNGEIIAADSRTVYKGMDIGTAKPTSEEQKLVPHHGLDVVSPGESFNVVNFQTFANRAIADIASRGKVPFLVGGSGLYIDAVIFNFGFRSPADPINRRALESLSTEELQRELERQGIDPPVNKHNRRHLIRALETAGETPSHAELRKRTLLIGLDVEKSVLEERIRARVEMMVKAGLVEEAQQLADRYGWDMPASQSTAYKAFRPYLTGQISLEAAKQQLVRYDMQYAKRQKTWFKRNPHIHWISKSEEAVDLATTFLNK